MKKRSAYLPGNKVLPETKAAFTEAAAQLGTTSTVMRLVATAEKFGQLETSQGTLSEVIARELER
ncbi:hypothetical protein SAMN04487914_108107 [Arthrobacter sp. ok909]|uniref:hypothetical protein n=1 Tax=Arthrobacter sp. ok909 TaxID=1761746 RepID=UPI000891556E|nr:hypothetical protein [Arthrobacter sp. ok909]SDP33565.1 hypothetical protein SAMN04487914_108107 [Arthrobacter sp. ok909]